MKIKPGRDGPTAQQGGMVDAILHFTVSAEDSGCLQHKDAVVFSDAPERYSN